VTRHSLGDAVEPADAPEDDADLPWPSRPGAIELAAALLIVGGVIGLFGALSAASSIPAGVEPFLVLTVALDIGSVIVGLLVRLGRSWILAVNYVAVLGFLDLLGAGASPLQLTLGLADILVVVILFVHKPWFDELRLRRSAG
jgi:hypothetical protein